MSCLTPARVVEAIGRKAGPYDRVVGFVACVPAISDQTSSCVRGRTLIRLTFRIELLNRMDVDFASVRALIFDLDGLLIDSEPLWFEVETSFVADLGHVWTREAADRCMGQGAANLLRTWREMFRVDIDIERGVRRLIDEMVARASRVPLQIGAQRLLDTARQLGLPMAVASSSPRRLVEAMLEAKGISDYFRIVVSGQDVVRGKPEPDIFALTAERLNLPARCCLVLEDTLSGVKAAVAAGAPVIAVPSALADEIRGLASLVARDLDEVASLLEERKGRSGVAANR